MKKQFGAAPKRKSGIGKHIGTRTGGFGKQAVETNGQIGNRKEVIFEFFFSLLKLFNAYFS